MKPSMLEVYLLSLQYQVSSQIAVYPLIKDNVFLCLKGFPGGGGCLIWTPAFRGVHFYCDRFLGYLWGSRQRQRRSQGVGSYGQGHNSPSPEKLMYDLKSLRWSNFLGRHTPHPQTHTIHVQHPLQSHTNTSNLLTPLVLGFSILHKDQVLDKCLILFW